ncbi:MAG: Glutamine transport ATP-binding protein GlnQ [Gemmatimonadaceae bacterium]|nr:Glutamine transport ATP-binding protein GlnQ [Gemmatimonadaceae bacterium]
MVPALSLRSVTKRYRSPSFGALSPITVLRDVSLDVSLGEIVIVAGPRGAGKTTLIRCAGGVSRPTFGRILWLGTDARLLSATPSAAIVGESPLSPGSMSVENALRYHCAVRGPDVPPNSSRLGQVLDTVGLGATRTAVVHALPPTLLRRVALAEALMVDARLLLLDETATGLCPSAAHAFATMLQSIAAQQRGILICSREREILPRSSARRFTLLGGSIVQAETTSSTWAMRAAATNRP